LEQRWRDRCTCGRCPKAIKEVWDMKAIFAALVMALAACAHALRAEPAGVRAEQNDAPAISPWARPPPNASIDQGAPSSDVPADVEQAL